MKVWQLEKLGKELSSHRKTATGAGTRGNSVLGGESLQRSISASAWGGHIAVIGFLDQPDAKISLP